MSCWLSHELDQAHLFNGRPTSCLWSNFFSFTGNFIRIWIFINQFPECFFFIIFYFLGLLVHSRPIWSPPIASIPPELTHNDDWSYFMILRSSKQNICPTPLWISMGQAWYMYVLKGLKCVWRFIFWIWML